MDKELSYMETAYIFSQQSKARRLKVGAVLVSNDRIICCGYNGTISGTDNNCELEKYNHNTGYIELVTKKEVIHCEANIMLFAAKHGISTNNCELYITHSPCFACSVMIIQCGISKVVYSEEYRSKDGIQFLKKNKVKVKKKILL